MNSSQAGFENNSNLNLFSIERSHGVQSEEALSVNNSNYGRSISVFQPKLLKIRGYNTMQKPNMELQHINQKKKVKKKIIDLKKEEKELNEDKKLSEKVVSFYKNPFQYMDYLIESYFKSHFNNMGSTFDFKKFKTSQEALQVPLEVNCPHPNLEQLYRDFESLCQKTKEDIKQIIDTETKNKFTQEEEKNNQFKGKISYSRTSEPDAEEIKSEPVDQNEIQNAFFNNSSKSKFKTVVHSRADIKNAILNDKYSSLNKENLLRKTLDCLKGEKLQLPKNNFLKVNDLNINDTNRDEMIYTKNLINIQRQYDQIRISAENTIIDQIGKTIQKEQDIYNNLMEKACNSVNKMEEDGKVTEELLSHVKSRLNEEFNKEVVNLGINQLNIHGKNLEDIRKELNQGDREEQKIESILERVKMIEENNKKTEEEIEKFLKERGLVPNEQDKVDTDLSDREIEKLYNKFKSKPKKKNHFSYNNSTNFKKNSNSKKVVRPTTNMINPKYK